MTSGVSGFLAAGAGVLTERVEDDASFEHGNVDHVGPGGRRRGGVRVAGSLDAVGPRLGLVPLDEPVPGVLDEKRQEEAGHEDRRGRGLVGQLAEALVLEHEGGVSVELDRLVGYHLLAVADTHMNKGRRDDDAGAELPEDSGDGVVRGDVGSNHNRREDSERAGRQHDKQ